MSRTQYLVIFGGLLCNMIDGYDLSVIGFALPHLPVGFASPVMKGWIVSMGLIGMAVGAIVLSPLADRYGRRLFIIGGVALNLVAICATALVSNAEGMLVGRFFTGVAVGVLSSLSIVLAQEYASAGKRNLATGFVTIGFSVGSVVGGIVGLSLVNAYGGAWQVFFVFGGVLTAIVLIYTVFFMPESLSFLVAQRTTKSRTQIAKISKSMGLTDVNPEAVLPPEREGTRDGKKGSLLDKQFRTRTLLLWIGYTVVNAAYYFVATWTPQLITNSSGSTATGTTAGTVLSLGSVVGAIAFGIIGMKVLSTKLAWISLVVAMAAQIVFALTMEGGLALALAGILGVAAFASLTSYVSSAPQLYPILLRGKGLGSMYGISRIGSIAAPILAGYAVAFMSAENMYLCASLLFGISGCVAFVLWRLTSSHFTAERAALAEPADTLV
ncbi:MFS transporter [Arthrobacter methylotrophus]|uniref:MFS transporter n=1 Tax=Arthrobacter methylotrophus TaxID=121291 RepID=A0ABV5UNJ8_9MICC